MSVGLLLPSKEINGPNDKVQAYASIFVMIKMCLARKINLRGENSYKFE